MHFYNLVTRVNYESRFNQRSEAEDELLKYLLFADEAPLSDAVVGDSGFAQRYEQLGPFDAQGRSLRQLNLKTRLFAYRLSPLIDSCAFAGLPDGPKSRLLKRLQAILDGRDDSEEFAYLSKDERRAIREILCETMSAKR